MSTIVVVPVRGIATGKSRLAGVLDTPARAQFTTWLLEHTLTAVGAWCGTLASCIVVSTCARVAGLSRARGAMVLAEEGAGGLNAAAALGRNHACTLNAASVLVLACDLPLLDASALHRFAKTAVDADVAIAPDRGGHGTNALIVRCGSPFDFRFGEDSCARHSEAAAARGLALAVHRDDALAFDVDTPDDYARWLDIDGQGAVRPVV
jgi:2-phospho-L-lactate/phosphoenolpyruvate guanylyltransferase